MDISWSASAGLILLALLYYFYETPFLYYFRLVMYNFSIFLSTFWGLVFTLFTKKDHRNLEYAGFFLKIYTRIFLGIQFELYGIEHLQNAKKPVIIVANHQSTIDMIATFETYYYPVGTCATVQKRINQYYPVYGWFTKRCRTIFLGQRKHKESIENVSNGVKQLLAEKINVLMYAEGTRNSGEILPFRKGPFHIAIESQGTILPIVHSNYSSFIDRKGKEFKYGGKVIVKALPPVPTAGLTSKDVDALTEKVRSEMIKVYIDISEKAKT